jgi:hypothetical protein
MNREKNLMKYGFASILLLASFLMTVPANQYQSIFAQTGEEGSEDNQQNVTEVETEENTTDVEVPEFENETAAFTPPPEGDREAPPIPSDAIKGADIPKELPPTDTDSQPLSVSNRTELLEVLPANSTKIIEHVDEDLKNSTGEGLLPPAILDKIISGEDQGNNNTILDISTPEELDEIKNFSDSTINQTSEEAVEEGDVVSNITNATGLGGLLDESVSNATNATSAETPSEDQEQSDDGEQGDGEAVNMTNATGAGATGSEDDEQQQEQDEEDTEDGEQSQAGAGEAVNMTNATSGELINATGATGQTGSEDDEQQQEQDEEDTEDGEQSQAGAGATGSEDDEQQQEQDEEDTDDQEEQQQEAATSVTNATAGMLNTTNATSMLNATGLEDDNEDSEDEPED